MHEEIGPLGLDSNDSWSLTSDGVSLGVTRQCGMLSSVVFTVAGRELRPFSVAPWVGDSQAAQALADPVARLLQGDFFCMPFGGDPTRVFQGEAHPNHGDTAAGLWVLESLREDDSGVTGSFVLETTTRPGWVSKEVRLVRGQSVIYQKHTLHGLAGPMSFGHHAMLNFLAPNGPGRLSCSQFKIGQVAPRRFEDPASGGYTSLKPGGVFSTLAEVPVADGTYADLRRHPACPGYENLVMLAGRGGDLAWNAVVFEEAGYVWFSLKDPRVLPSTVLWLSNGGRHYFPWLGRHRGVLGVEDVLSYFADGLPSSAEPNSISEKGIPTCVTLSGDKAHVVPYIMGVAEVPAGCKEILAIRARLAGGVDLITDSGGSIAVDVDLSYLKAIP